MKRTAIFVIVAALLLFSLPMSALAELKPADHNGFFFGLGIGGGSLKLKLDNNQVSVESEAETGGAVNLYLGVAISRSVLLGLSLDGWTKQYEDDFTGTDATWTFANATACVWFYPTDYLFLKAGPSLARTELEISATGIAVTGSEEGFGIMIGLGGELRLGSKFALVPQAQYLHQNYGDIGADTDLEANYFTITIGVAWYW